MSEPVSVTFHSLVFLRCNYTFVYVATTFYPNIAHWAIGEVTVPSVDAASAPKQGHLSYADDPTSMTLQFVSGSRDPSPCVRYGLTSGNLRFVEEGTSDAYSAADMCHAPANQTSQQLFRDPGFVHTVAMRGLQPDTVYFYKYGNVRDGWSSTQRFRTAPSYPRNVTFIAFGDQVRYGVLRAVAQSVAPLALGLGYCPSAALAIGRAALVLCGWR